MRCLLKFICLGKAPFKISSVSPAYFLAICTNRCYYSSHGGPYPQDLAWLCGPKWQSHENAKTSMFPQSLRYLVSNGSVESWGVCALLAALFPLSCSRTWPVPSPDFSFDSWWRTSVCLCPETNGVFASHPQGTTAWPGTQRRRPAPEGTIM